MTPPRKSVTLAERKGEEMGKPTSKPKTHPGAPKKPEARIWILEVETDFGWLPLVSEPAHRVRSHALDRLALARNAWSQELLRTTCYRREP